MKLTTQKLITEAMSDLVFETYTTKLGFDLKNKIEEIVTENEIFHDCRVTSDGMDNRLSVTVYIQSDPCEEFVASVYDMYGKNP